MLGPERYQQVISALNLLYEKNLGWNEKTRRALVIEQYKTDRALNYLGIDSKDPPGKLPFVNQLFLPQEKTQPFQTLEIEVAGMCNAGKSTLAKNASEQIPGGAFLEEGGQRLKRILDARAEEDLIALGGYYSAYHLTRLIAVELETRLLTKRIQNQNKSAQIRHDRGWLDTLAFLRAHFLFGRVSWNAFSGLSQLACQHLNPENAERPAYGLIICLITPKLSLAREGPREKPGRVMQIPFLTILYEQYLRLYAELLRNKKNCPLSFVCLDTSGSFKENQVLFNQTVEEIIVALKGS